MTISREAILKTLESQTVTARRDENGFACAIDVEGITILHLNPGTERNEVCISKGVSREIMP